MNEPVKIALLADTHTTHSTKDDKPRYQLHLDQAIQQVNEAHVDFVMIAGDLTDGGLPEQYEEFRKDLLRFQAPVVCVPGNHDIGDKHLPGKPGGVTAVRLRRYESWIGPSFFATTLSGVRVLAFNSSLMGSGLDREHDQWEFLEDEMPQTGRPPTLILMHYPAFLETPDEPGGDYWNLEPEPRARFLSLIQRGRVDLVASGHLHRPLRLHYQSTTFLGTHPIAFGIPEGKQPEGWTLVTLQPDGAAQTESRTVAH